MMHGGPRPPNYTDTDPARRIDLTLYSLSLVLVVNAPGNLAPSLPSSHVVVLVLFVIATLLLFFVLAQNLFRAVDARDELIQSAHGNVSRKVQDLAHDFRNRNLPQAPSLIRRLHYVLYVFS